MDKFSGPADQKEISCLVENIYHEARGEGFAGMYAVSMVVFNRVADHRYPDTVCEVVKQARTDSTGFPIRHKCQFSWYCDGKSDKMLDLDAFARSLHVAEMVFSAVTDTEGTDLLILDLTSGATHYHTHAVSPDWAQSIDIVKTTTIGSHKFYRWD